MTDAAKPSSNSDRIKYAGKCVAWVDGKVFATANSFEELQRCKLPDNAVLEYLGQEML
jgi:hypothetical protein